MKETYKHYLIGVLQSIELVLSIYDEEIIARELAGNLLQGEPVKTLKKLAKDENIKIKWRAIGFGK